MGGKAAKPNLLTMLKTIKDFRRKQGQRHALEISLIIIIMAIMGGAKGERAIARFAKNNQAALIKALRIKRKEVPKRSAIQRIIRGVDFKELESVFSAWSIRITPIKPKDFVSVDGKAIRGTVEDATNSFQNFVSLVSAFASERRQILSAAKIETKKENEIPSVQELIEMLDLKDVTFTLDALHCQTETAAVIKKTGNHYIIGVKGNQPKLYEDLKKSVKARPSASA